jgi:hypothetical protein
MLDIDILAIQALEIGVEGDLQPLSLIADRLQII